MNHPETIRTDTPGREALAALIDRAEEAIAAQSRSYRTESDPDHADRCAWNTWRTLQALTAAVRPLTQAPPDDGTVLPLRPHSHRAAA